MNNPTAAATDNLGCDKQFNCIVIRTGLQPVSKEWVAMVVLDDSTTVTITVDCFVRDGDSLTLGQTPSGTYFVLENNTVEREQAKARVGFW